jgi:hypothetical protein
MPTPPTIAATNTDPAPKLAGRGSLFISHASPEDNAFVLWLGGRLSLAGYDVWADLLTLQGGDDWARKLEHALRHKARKLLLVATSKGVEKQGVRNEIQIATETAKKLADTSFIVPLRLENFESPFLTAHIQWIDFKNRWGEGLAELLELLDSTKALDKTVGPHSESLTRWAEAQRARQTNLLHEPEAIVSNWLPIRQLPATIRRYAFTGAISDQQVAAALASSSVPLFRFGLGFFGFAPPQDYALIGQHGASPRLMQEIPLDDFREGGTSSLSIKRREANNALSNLIRSHIEQMLQSRGLFAYPYSNRTSGFWVHSKLIPKRISFDWGDGWKSSRALNGEVSRGKDKDGKAKKLQWHYGVTPFVRIDPEALIQLMPRLIFTEDGQSPLSSPSRMHSLRRSIPKGWRNDRWRDLMLAFLSWLSNGEETFTVPAGTDRTIQLAAFPITMTAPVSIRSESDISAANREEGDPVYDQRGDEELDDG